MMALLWLILSHRGGKISLVRQSGISVGRFNKFHHSFSGTPRELKSVIGHKTFSAKTGLVLGKLGWQITLVKAQAERNPAKAAWN